MRADGSSRIKHYSTQLRMPKMRHQNPNESGILEAILGTCLGPVVFDTNMLNTMAELGLVEKVQISVEC